MKTAMAPTSLTRQQTSTKTKTRTPESLPSRSSVPTARARPPTALPESSVVRDRRGETDNLGAVPFTMIFIVCRVAANSACHGSSRRQRHQFGPRRQLSHQHVGRSAVLGGHEPDGGGSDQCRGDYCQSNRKRLQERGRQ